MTSPSNILRKREEEFDAKFRHCQNLKCDLCKQRGIIKSFHRQTVKEYLKWFLENVVWQLEDDKERVYYDDLLSSEIDKISR